MENVQRRDLPAADEQDCRAVAGEGGLLTRPIEDCRAVAGEGGLPTRPSEDCRAVAGEGGFSTRPTASDLRLPTSDFRFFTDHRSPGPDTGPPPNCNETYRFLSS